MDWLSRFSARGKLEVPRQDPDLNSKPGYRILGSHWQVRTHCRRATAIGRGLAVDCPLDQISQHHQSNPWLIEKSHPCIHPKRWWACRARKLWTVAQGFGGYSVKDGRRGEEPGYQATRVVSGIQAAGGEVELETTETAKKSQILRDLPAVGPGWMEIWLKQVAVLNGRVKADARTLLYTGFFSMMNGQRWFLLFRKLILLSY